MFFYYYQVCVCVCLCVCVCVCVCVHVCVGAHACAYGGGFRRGTGNQRVWVAAPMHLRAISIFIRLCANAVSMLCVSLLRSTLRRS